jgi:hypothetical protein
MSCCKSLASIILFFGGVAAGPVTAQGGTPTFSDRAAFAGVDFFHSNPSSFIQSQYSGGGAAGDFNRDGWMDFFAVSGGNARDHLYINNGDGTFTDRATAWGMVTVHLGKGATAGDYNDDGWLDLYVTSAGPVGAQAGGHHKLYRNNGNNTFTEVAAAAGVNSTHPTKEGGFGSAFGDYDLDGDLDLFVAGFSSGFTPSSRLFRNDGDGTFTDVTIGINLWGGGSGGVSGFAPRFADMNGDRYPEILLVGDFGTSRLFRNNMDGTFTNVTNAWNAGQDENGMGTAFADFNNDGLFDWYVTSIYWPALGWTGNKLYLNTPSAVLNEVSMASQCFDGGYGWGAVGVDFDHDGWVDIAETNGDNGTGQFLFEQSYLWMSDGDGTFTESALALGLDHTGAGRGMLNFDYDNDGDQDVVIFVNFGTCTLWNNELAGTETAWLRVLLDTTSNDDLAPDGYGSVLSATVRSETIWRHLYGGDNMQSASELSAHFGLGTADVVDELRVEWSNGMVTVLNDVAVNQTITVSPPEDDGWTRVGLGIGGDDGVPQLRGAGQLTAGSRVTLNVTNGRPSSTLHFLFSPFLINAPFKGGVFVPDATFLVDFATDSSGAWAIGANWPNGLPAGTPIWFQGWQQDPSGLLGWISTNGLRATTP